VDFCNSTEQLEQGNATLEDTFKHRSGWAIHVLVLEPRKPCKIAIRRNLSSLNLSARKSLGLTGPWLGECGIS